MNEDFFIPYPCLKLALLDMSPRAQRLGPLTGDTSAFLLLVVDGRRILSDFLFAGNMIGLLEEHT